MPYSCDLIPGKTFLGVTLGMTNSQAFHALQSNARNDAWVVYNSAVVPRKYGYPKAGIAVSDWESFRRTDKWMLRGWGFPCVDRRYVFLRIVERQVSDFSILCEKFSAGVPFR
jgi:hypothetical protein